MTRLQDGIGEGSWNHWFSNINSDILFRYVCGCLHINSVVIRGSNKVIPSLAPSPSPEGFIANI